MRLEIPLMLAAMVTGTVVPQAGRPVTTLQPVVDAPTPHPPVVTIVAREYRFNGPDSIESGPTAFRLLSAGREQHVMALVRIADSHTFADFRRALTSKQSPAWAIPAGGVGTIAPGGAATTILNLEPGLYAMYCDMEDAHGTPHMMEGMIRALIVSPRGIGKSMPATELTIDLTDFAFLAPDTIQSGDRTIGVRNSGSQPHMALVWRLAPGRSASTVIHWIDTPSDHSHPIALLGGVPDLAPGREAQLSLRLKVGHYLLICLIEDPKDHKTHYAKGMVKEFTVR